MGVCGSDWWAWWSRPPTQHGFITRFGKFGDHNEAKCATTTAAMTHLTVALQDVSFILLGTFSVISFREKQETSSFL